jgi:hypothetical protein
VTDCTALAVVERPALSPHPSSKHVPRKYEGPHAATVGSSPERYPNATPVLSLTSPVRATTIALIALNYPCVIVAEGRIMLSDSVAVNAGKIRSRNHRSIPMVLGLVLVTAALLKGYELATGPVLPTRWFSSRWFLIGVVEFEFFLGLWLLLGFLARLAQRVTIACFIVFACFSSYLALSGAASCSCFGKVPMNPWVALAGDCAALTALSVWIPTEEAHANMSRRLRAWIFLVGFCLVGVPGAFVMGSHTPRTLAADGEIVGDAGVVGAGNLVVLEPEKWVDKRFPLLKHIDLGTRLAEGQWIVVLYRHDCPKCQSAVLEYRELAADLAKQSNSPRVAMIELPPFGDSADLFVSPQSPVTLARLSDRVEWFVEVPLKLVLSDATVLSIAR